MIDNLLLSTELIQSEDPALSAGGMAGCLSRVFLSRVYCLGSRCDDLTIIACINRSHRQNCSEKNDKITTMAPNMHVYSNRVSALPDFH